MSKRQHNLTLDALRGIAAFAVMIYHQQHSAIMGHGYLAVDFFFLLSGFVIAKAYEDRLLSSYNFLDFALIRVARLYPLLMAATLVSVGYMGMNSVRADHDLRWLGLLPAALLALPDPSRTFAPDPFPLLPVVWSLFFELLANFTYGAFAKWLSSRRLFAILVGSSVLLLLAIAHRGNGELGNTYATLWAGIPRVMFSFFAGVLGFRLHSRGRLVYTAIPPLVLGLILVTTLAAPHDMSWAYDALCIFAIFPIILLAAMNVEPHAKWKQLAQFSADLSYPMYLFHLPLMLWIGFVLTHWAVTRPIQDLSELVDVSALSYAIHAFFDRPLQNLLKARLAAVTGKSGPMYKASVS